MRALLNKNSKFYIFFYTLFIYGAALGDWKTINVVYGALPKVVSVGVIGIAFIYFLVSADIEKFKILGRFWLVFASVILLVVLWSIMIWIADFQEMNFILKGVSKISFQFLNITILVCGVYLFEEKTPIYTFYGIAGANITIIMISAVKHGIGTAVSDIIENVVTMGDAVTGSRFIRDIEIHDITFVMGLFVIYFLLFCKEKYRFIYLGISLILFLAGLKRIALLSVAMALVFGFVCGFFNSKWKSGISIAISVLIVGFCFYYVKIIHSGEFTAFLKEHDIDLMGRDHIYDFIARYYDFSPSYGGKGYEFCVRLLKDMKGTSDMVVNISAVHNDILKMYVELGFWGFFLWSSVCYVFQTYWYSTRCNANTTLCFMALNLYMLVSFMTDNTMFYYWSSMVLRLLPMSFFFAELKRPNAQVGKLARYVT